MKNKDEPLKKTTINIQLPVNVHLAAGLITGLLISIGFHPIDRALYMKNVDKHPQNLFSFKYFKQPFSGLRNTVYQRMLSTFIYFFMQATLRDKLTPKMEGLGYSSLATQMSIGFIAGLSTGICSNWIYAVKYYGFRHSPKAKPSENAIKMYKKGGIYPFFKGIYPSMMRDSIYGVSYETISHLLDQHLINKINISDDYATFKHVPWLLGRFFASTVAIILSSPFNYTRNIQFATLPEKKQPLVLDILTNFWRESNKHLKETAEANWLTRTKFFQEKLMINAGTLRAGVGMSLAQFFMNHLDPKIRSLDVQTDISKTT